MPAKFDVKVTDASKDGEVVKFTIQTKTKECEDSEAGKIVFRQYEDFEYLLHCLTTRTDNDITGIITPSLPPRPVVSPTSESKINLKPPVTNTRAGDEYYQDCKRLQQFLQDVAEHSVFQNEDSLEVFLTADEPPPRAAVKKGLIDSFINVVDNARFQHYKDFDEDFQRRRDNTNSLLLHVKQCLVNESKLLASENVCSAHYGNLAMTCRNSATVDIQNSKVLVRILGQFSDTLDELSLQQNKTTNITKDTIGFSLELYARKLSACQEMLFRRTCKLVDRDNAIKALDKAKPKNHDQLLSAKEEAEKIFDKVSETAGVECEKFTERRIQHFRDSLTSLAERQIENHNETCEMLSRVIEDLKLVNALE